MGGVTWELSPPAGCAFPQGTGDLQKQGCDETLRGRLGGLNCDNVCVCLCAVSRIYTFFQHHLQQSHAFTDLNT